MNEKSINQIKGKGKLLDYLQMNSSLMDNVSIAVMEARIQKSNIFDMLREKKFAIQIFINSKTMFHKYRQE